MIRFYLVRWYDAGNAAGNFAGERRSIVLAYDAKDAVTQVEVTFAHESRNRIIAVDPAPDGPNMPLADADMDDVPGGM